MRISGILLAFLLCFPAIVSATHNRAGEIIYKRIEPFSKLVGGVNVAVYHYSITVIKYTKHNDESADRCVDTVYFGDGEKGVAPRINGGQTLDCNCGFINNVNVGCGEIIYSDSDPDHTVKVNIFTVTHYYPGAGNYLIRSTDPNRNANVNNISSSVTEPFYIESSLVINSTIGANSSPVFGFPPIDRACVRQCFEHNPGAFDPDGDSLSYNLTTSRGYNGETVGGYKYPPGSYTINALTGELRWCAPPENGEYNLAFIVSEWRKNTNGKYVKIGYVLRDMQVLVEDCGNEQPPLAVVPPDTCVEAGSLLTMGIRVSDPDVFNRITIAGEGSPFSIQPPFATLSNTTGPGIGYVSIFTWQTSCDHIRALAHQATFKVQDNGATNAQVSFSSFNIRVVPPTIKDLSAEPAGSSIRLTWSAPLCDPPGNPLTGYRIYRSNTCDSLIFNPCAFSPEVNGYVFLKQIGKDTTSFLDDNDGDGLVVGQNYNYIVTAIYEDGSESSAGSGVCAELSRDVPVMLNVSIDSTSATDGVVFVRWARPLTNEGNLDTVAVPGPYTFVLMHRPPGAGTQQAVFTTTAVSVYGLDTAFYHTTNTLIGPHEYQVMFFAGDGSPVGSSQRAGSVFLSLSSDDGMVHLQWAAKTPWTNKEYDIYRKAPGESGFSLIATTDSLRYTDSADVRNGFVYCYRVKSKGSYSDPGIFHPLENFSQDSCMVPVDRTPPCTPELELSADCPAGYVRLSWTDVTKVCGRSGDVRHYIVYHKPTVGAEYIRVAEGDVREKEFFELPQVSGCYAVQAIDTNDNRGEMSVPFCIDNCPVFELPNVFTPNGDGANDHFKAIRVRQIKKISLSIVDRWGNTVYQTTDPYFKWDGVSAITNVPCNDGTYFYICDVFEPRLAGEIIRPLKGTVHLAR